MSRGANQLSTSQRYKNAGKGLSSTMGGTFYVSKKHQATATFAHTSKTTFAGKEAYQSTQGVKVNKRGSIDDKSHA